MVSNCIEARILARFLASPGEFISGETLAQAFDLSRVSIWGRFEKWRERGFVFEAVRNKGYALKELPKGLDGDVVGAWLHVEGAAGRAMVRCFDALDSTNSEVERRLANGETAPLCVFTKEQLQGRGRQGRVWHSPEGTLCISFGFRPQIRPAELSLFPLWLGISLCRWLNEAYDLDLQVKWPNDIVCEGRKLGGILIESRIERDTTRDLVAGIGLNVNSMQGLVQAGLEDRSSSIFGLKGDKVDINRLTASFIKTTLDAYEGVISGTYKSELIELWPQFDALKDKAIVRHSKEGELPGFARGIDADGGLIFEDHEGQQHSLNSGEVSLTHMLRKAEG